MKITLELTKSQAQMVRHALQIGVEDGSLTNNDGRAINAAQRLIDRINAALAAKQQLRPG